jgi:hypothetical protein
MTKAAFLLPVMIAGLACPALAADATSQTTTPLSGTASMPAADAQQKPVMRSRWSLTAPRAKPTKKTQVAKVADPNMQGPAVPAPQRIKLPPKHRVVRTADESRQQQLQQQRSEGSQVLSRMIRGDGRNRNR